MSAQSWSLKGIDPKVREAAREAAARQGMSLGEYLNRALQHQQEQNPDNPSRENLGGFSTPRRPIRAGQTSFVEDEEVDWAPPANPLARSTDPAHLSQRIDAIERRTQLAVTGLDRAVSTIDRSVLGLAARVEESESISRESASRIAGALDHFRVAGDTLGGRLHSAEDQIHNSTEALTDARAELEEARVRLEGQARTAETVARKAEAAAAAISSELEARASSLSNRLDAFEDRTREALEHSLEEARHAAEEASHASFQAIAELRDLQHRLAKRVNESEDSTRRAIETAVEETQAALVQEVVRLESELGANVGLADDVRAEQKALLARIEKAETGAREATAGLRQAAGAAIADLRNAQLGLSARVKQMEDGGGAGLDLSEFRAQQQDIAARVSQLESQPVASPVDDALAAFARRLEEVETGITNAGVAQKLNEVGGAVKTLDDNLKNLAERIAETESTANSAIRTLEETVSGLSARMQGDETEALRAMLESRLGEMAQSVQTMVGEAREEFAAQMDANAQSGAHSEAMEEALADVNRRLAAAERRQAQTIEAISIEIKRMSETVDRRLRTVESRNDDAAGAAVREELAKMSHTLEARFEEIERREAAAFDRMGLEIGRLSDRMDERVGAVEARSAQAIEHVGDQVARMAERFSARQDQIARELGERMLDSEERSQARVSEAVGAMMQRVAEAEERSAEAVAPMQKAVSSIASRLETVARDAETTSFGGAVEIEDFAAPSSPPISPLSSSPMSSAQPLRAGPLPPSTAFAPPPHHADDDIYFADADEEISEPDYLDDEMSITDEPVTASKLDEADAFTPAPPPGEDDWAPEIDFDDAPVAAAPAVAPVAPPAAAKADTADAFDDIDFEDDFLSPAPAPEAKAQPAAPPVIDLAAPVEDIPAPAPPPGKNDYLAAARKAAQAQALPAKTRAKPSKQNTSAAGTPQLRGPSRVILWGAAGAVALALAGGAWFVKTHQAPSGPSPAAPEPDSLAPTEAAPPPATPYDTHDASAAFGPEAPPESAVPATGATESGAPVSEPESATPPTAAIRPGATPASARPGAVVAGPLAPRSQSLEQAAQTGDTVAQYELALQRLSANRTGEGVQLIRNAANRGLAMAQYRLAKLYERGEGVPADLTLARQWTERAAGAGNRRAMHDLGVYFARGEGAPLDEAAAFRWFRQAAELGVADSQYNLGVLYQQGRGVGASPSEAMFWFLVAARQGDEDASARADALQAQLQPMQVEQARARAQAFRPRAASGPANGEFGARTWSSAPSRPAT